MADTENTVRSINFDDGIKEYTINGDENRKLKINMNDIGLIDRIERSIRMMQKEVQDIKDVELSPDGTAELEEYAKPIRELNRIMRKEFDAVFYPGASNIVFGKQNPLSTVGGVSLYERFMKAFLDVVKPEMQKENAKSEEHIRKYKSQYDKPMPPAQVRAGK